MRLIIGVLVAAACIGCSSGSDSGSDTGVAATPQQKAESVDQRSTCELIADAELADALGQAVNRHESQSPTRCVYYTADPVVYADIEIDRQNADASWQGATGGNDLIDAPQDSLAGIGDKAFFGPRDRLYIRKGSSFAAIEAGFDDKVRDRARRIARVVVSKL